MFGFLRLKSCLLSESDSLVYRSHFCAVCHAMTEFGGRLSSLLTNYDVTFWLLLQSALDSRAPSSYQGAPCTALPWRSVSVRPLSAEVAATLASLNLVLIHAKVEDDQSDGQSWKPRLAQALYSGRFQKAEDYLRERGHNVEMLRGLPIAQSAAERSAHPTLDSLALPTEATLGEVFAAIAGLQGKPDLEPWLRDFGESLGGYLYLWDALIDLPDDLRQGGFNALTACGISHPRDARVSAALNQRLSTLESLLRAAALGPEGELCWHLLTSLRSRLVDKMGPSARRPTFPRPGARLARAGFLRVQNDECCEADCCNCGCCDCNVCDCNPCQDNKDQCCELNCCDCKNGCCCCPCGGSGGSGNSSCCGDGSGNSGTSCCGGSNTTNDALCCLTDSCFCYSGDPGLASSDSSSTSPRRSLFERWHDAWNRGRSDFPSTPGGLLCPACKAGTLSLKIGEIEICECRNCGGMWLQEKDLEALSKMAQLPHNLLTRYPSESVPIKHLAGHRACPACEKALSAIPYLEVPVEMCKSCRGFWVEHGRVGKLLKAKRSPQKSHQATRLEWRCPYCDSVAGGGDTCQSCGAPRPSSGFTGKLA